MPDRPAVPAPDADPVYEHPTVLVEHPLVRGLCPSCNLPTLFLGRGGYVTCSYIGCADPAAASDLLERRGGAS